MSAAFVYDGDGRQVKSTINGVTTLFVGAHYEVQGTTITKYYFAGPQRIAMRANGTLTYLLGDHLGSTSIVTNASGAKISEQRYKPWGETRFTSGTLPTKYQYTGQRSKMNSLGLYFYVARWYDPALGRFAQADSIVPGGVQGLDRYAYVSNNPLQYTDPSGHVQACADGDEGGGCGRGANTKEIFTAFDYKNSRLDGAFAEYYSKLHVAGLDIEKHRVNPNPATFDQMDSAIDDARGSKARASVSVSPKDHTPAMDEYPSILGGGYVANESDLGSDFTAPYSVDPGAFVPKETPTPTLPPMPRLRDWWH
jgi:RHS repeat-associated protein